MNRNRPNKKFTWIIIGIVFTFMVGIGSLTLWVVSQVPEIDSKYKSYN